jgi:hypothetical protein
MTSLASCRASKHLLATAGVPWPKFRRPT